MHLPIPIASNLDFAIVSHHVTSDLGFDGYSENDQFVMSSSKSPVNDDTTNNDQYYDELYFGLDSTDEEKTEASFKGITIFINHSS